jgi:2-dehydro-3-deoxyphosphogluconate aldolase/(4S)-4-hydroxy-2-oxoglutarate aldolase
MNPEWSSRVTRCGVLAILRLDSADDLLDVAKALLAGGIDVVEFTMTTPGALDVLRDGTREFAHEILLGAGTVLDPETARAAILAGARFVVSPTLRRETIEMCHRYGVVAIPGALTPTEILSAWESGADLVKVFPASTGGPRYIRDVLAPLPQLRLIPTGGVDLDNTEAFIRAGASAVAVGSNLVDRRAVDQRHFAELTSKAREYRAAVERGRRVETPD